MIHKIHKGKLESFKRALDYNLHKPETSIIAGNMLGDTTEQLLEEFREQQTLNPDARRSMVHAMIRLPPGEHLDPPTWAYVAERYMEHLGYQDAPYVVFLEQLGEHDAHVHIVASAIRDDGRRVDDSNDYYRGQQIMRELEEELGLRRVPSSHEVGITAPELDEMHAAVRRGDPTTRRMLQKAILEAAQGKPTLSELIERLERAGVDVGPKLRRDGLLTGMTYRLPSGATMKGTHLGRAFTARGLSKYLHVGYDPKRDLPTLERARLRFDARDTQDARDSREAALAYVRTAIDHEVAVRLSLPELLQRLQARGITTFPNLARSGHLSGLTYMIHDHTFKASEIGREYTPKGLEKRGVPYDPELHHDQLRQLRPVSDEPAPEPQPVVLPALSDLLRRHEHPALVEHDWAQRAARAGLERAEIVRTLAESVVPLQQKLRESELHLAAGRLQALYEARAASPQLDDQVLAELGKAEESFLRAHHRLVEPGDHRQLFVQQIDQHLHRSLDELAALLHQPHDGFTLAEAHERFQNVLARFSSAVASHQRFHRALPELPPLLDERGLRGLRTSFERLQAITDAALQSNARFNLSARLAEFAANPQALAARAADQLWADRAALALLSPCYIHEQLLERGAHRWDRSIADPALYAELVTARAHQLAQRTLERLERRSLGLGSVATLALPSELRLAAQLAGLLTGKASPLGLASFTFSFAQLTWRYLERAARDPQERSR